MSITSLERIFAVAQFYAAEPESPLLNGFFNFDNSINFSAQTNMLTRIISQELCFRTLTDVDQVLKSEYLPHEQLAYLTYIAEEDSHPHSGRACYLLGKIYLGDREEIPNSCWEEPAPETAAYFLGKALEKGYTTTEARLAYAEAASCLGWADTALRWLPEDAPQSEIARAFLNHQLQLSQENEINLPAANENGIVPLQPTPKAAKLRQLLSPEGLLSKRQKFCKDAEALDKKFSSSVFRMREKLFEKEDRILAAKKRNARLCWLLPLLIALITLPGMLWGNGDGIQHIFYCIFIAICGNGESGALEGLSFLERLQSTLDADARSLLYAPAITAACMLTVVIWAYLRFLRKKPYIRQYVNYKHRLIKKNKLVSCLYMDPAVNYSDPVNMEMLNTNGYKDLNSLAKDYHKALTTPAAKLSFPSLKDSSYGDLSDAKTILEDYEAFKNAMRIVYSTGHTPCLWSGSSLLRVFYDLHSHDNEFADYFCAMFDCAAGHAQDRKDKKAQSYAYAQSSKLRTAVYQREESLREQERLEEEARREELFRASHPISKSSGSSRSPEDAQRGHNLFYNGSFSTNEELLSNLYHSGKISADQFIKHVGTDGDLYVTEPDDGH